MNPYSIDTKERTNVTIVLFLISFGICYLLNFVFNYFNISIPLYIESPTPFFVFGLLYKAFDKCLWKAKWIRFPLDINTPDLNGTWKGEYESSYKSDDCENGTKKGKVNMTITQSWTRIRIVSENEKSNSYSQLAGICVNHGKGIVLKFEYENDSDRNLEDTMNLHTGFTALKYDEKIDVLEGTYYTDRNRRTFGTVKYKRVAS